MEVWIVFALLAAIFANMAAQILVYRLWQVEGRLVKSQLAGTLAGLAMLVSLSFAGGGSGPGMADQTAANILIYLAFCYVYFHWNNMGETARRIRLLRELYDAPDGLTATDLQQRYSAREILERRLRRLIEARQVVERDARLFLASSAILRSARLVALAKRLVVGGRSELGDHDHITL